MKNVKSAFAVICLSAVYASAHAQNYGAEVSINQYGVYTSYGMVLTGSYAEYYNLAGTYATGSGSNYSFSEGTYGTSLALNESFAGPGTGFAQSGYGFEEFLTFTNENPTGGVAYISVYSLLEEVQTTTAMGFAEDFGGVQEFGGSYFFGYNTVLMQSGAIVGGYTYNWTVDSQFMYNGYAFTYSHGGFTDVLGFGQSVEIGIWASGITQASATGSSVPAPAAIAPFALGLLGALRRRNKK